MVIMRQPNLAELDLNLLRVLDALLRERHLTRAAKGLGLSQPAASHALARLREHMGDPLFVRSSAGLVPTPRATALAPKLQVAMLALAECVSGMPAFDPRTARVSFTMSTADYGSFVLVPPLLEQLSLIARGVDVWVRSVREETFAELARGDADVHVGPIAQGATAPGIHMEPLFEEEFVCVVRADHPRVRASLDLDTYVDLPHVFVAPRGTPGGIVDQVLAKHRRKRRVAIAVPQFLLAPFLVAKSDMIVTIGRRVAEEFAAMLPLRILEPPVTLPPFVTQLVWHERTQDDLAHRWFRQQIMDTLPATTKRTKEKVRSRRR